jgi:hypothetical protein
MPVLAFTFPIFVGVLAALFPLPQTLLALLRRVSQ